MRLGLGSRFGPLCGWLLENTPSPRVVADQTCLSAVGFILTANRPYATYRLRRRCMSCLCLCLNVETTHSVRSPVPISDRCVIEPRQDIPACVVRGPCGSMCVRILTLCTPWSQPSVPDICSGKMCSSELTLCLITEKQHAGSLLREHYTGSDLDAFSVWGRCPRGHRPHGSHSHRGIGMIPCLIFKKC